MSNIISGIAYASSIPMVYILTYHFTRRNANWIILIIGIVLVFLMTIDSIKNLDWLNQTIFFGYRFVISAYIQMIYLINYQFYPTQIRASTGMFCASLATTQGVAQTWVTRYCNNNGVDVRFSFIIISLIAVVSIFFLKQTYGIPPPEIIE